LKRFIFIALLFISLGLQAQQGLQMQFAEQDSIRMQRQREMEYRQLISGNAPANILIGEDFKFPPFDYRAEINKNYMLSFGLSPISNYSYGGISAGSSFQYYSPFYSNAQILSAASYKLGEKFSVGGYSYGANSVFGAPTKNNGINDFDNYGSTLILQYKVSKNFKIETQINILKNGTRPPGIF
jgi:hypothetical protein